MAGPRARLILVEDGAVLALRQHLRADEGKTVILLQQADESSETLLGRIHRHAANLHASRVHLTQAAMLVRPRGRGTPWELRAKLAEELARCLAAAPSPELSFIAQGELPAPFQERLFSMVDALIQRCNRSLTILIHFEAVTATAARGGLRPAGVSALGATELSIKVGEAG